MKLDKLVGDRFKEKPAECSIDSHALMVRGGYMKFMASGIYSQYTALNRIVKKIENIMREEMDAVDGQEVKFPVVMPGSLWKESGRYDSIADELLRFDDRNDTPMVLGMTHEEAAVHLVRDYASTYTKYPFMIYQIQTKFRDEARPRAGLIRVREFTMKDAYSFHTSYEDLAEQYDRCFKAYERIFARVGIPETIAVEGDSGMMGGKISHEFMLLTPVGEDSIVICDECDYRSNMEAAECITPCACEEQPKPLELVNTPDAHTIEALCEFLNITPEKTCKAVAYQRKEDNSYVVIFLRGDLDVNETKVTNFLGCNIYPATITEESGIVAGFIGPKGLPDSVTCLYDSSLKGMAAFVCGGGKKDYHYVNFNMERDFGEVEYHDFAKAYTGGICPSCGKASLNISRGIEVGNIFQLGTRYTESMNMRYTDSDGELRYPIMGCYGIGVERLAASVCEAHHDDYGPIWPISIAPWQVSLCCVRADDEHCKAISDELYDKLQGDGIEVIYDDRNVRAGVMFSDSDLLGIPVRVVVSPRNLKENLIEITTRDKSLQKKVPVDEALSEVKALVGELLEKYRV